MAEFRMPSLGSDMVEGTLLEWRVKPGDRVKRGDIIAVVDTDKAAIEIEVFEDGVVETLIVQPGQKVPVGTVMAILREEATAAAPASPGPPAPKTVPTGLAGEVRAPLEGVPTGAPEPVRTFVPGVESPRIKASPYARKLAAERGIDLSMLRGTGPDGAICAADVKHAGPTEKPEVSAIELKETGEVRPFIPFPSEPAPQLPTGERPRAPGDPTAMRRAIAAAMSRSNREIPHYYLQTRIDMNRTLRWLEAENLRRSIKERILPVVPLIKAVALALGEVPELNGYWIDDRHQPQEMINVGFAIALRQGGLLTPAILQADMKTLDELMESLRDLITRTRAGRLRGSEMTDATITVTNLGDLGVEAVYGVIYPPQVGLVGFGKVMEQPWVENGMLGIRPVLTATLAADHRATDGRRGAQFLDALNRILQEPEKL